MDPRFSQSHRGERLGEDAGIFDPYPLVAILQGDESSEEIKAQAFESIVVVFWPKLHRMALNILGSEIDADDALQEGLLRWWRNKDKYQPIGPYEGWVYRVCKNAVLDYRRKIQRQEQKECLATDDFNEHNDYSLVFADPTSEINPAMAYEDREQARLLNDLILSLPNTDFSAVLYLHANGYKNAEIAEKLVLPLGTVQSRLHRAVKAFRLLIEQETEQAA